MFTDKISLFLQAGKGGDGLISFLREKFMPKGGPSGGNGGNGGSILLKVDENLISLEDLRNKRVIKAENGKSGMTSNKTGKNGKNVEIRVPRGTLVKENGEIIFDLKEKGQVITICQGGSGGRGNSQFKSSTNQAPYFATEGKIGEERRIDLELKIIADVGLIGFPNAGKSTFLKNATNARPKIGPYPFTTLHPNIGAHEFDDFSKIFIADIPGIIEKAHENKGLGHLFLKHIERTKILLYLIDISQRDAFENFEILRKELFLYKKELLEKPFLVALNKIDINKNYLEDFKEKYPFDKKTLFEISSLKKINLKKILHFIKNSFL